jgi:hypothetical protein
VADGAVAHRLRLRKALLLPLRGGEDDINEDEGVEVFRTVDGYDLEPLPTYSLRTPDQDDGVDYGAHGFMFNIENTAKRTVIITGTFRIFVVIFYLSHTHKHAQHTHTTPMILGFQVCSGHGIHNIYRLVFCIQKCTRHTVFCITVVGEKVKMNTCVCCCLCRVRACVVVCSLLCE